MAKKDATVEAVGTALAWTIEEDVWGAAPEPTEGDVVVRSDMGRDVAFLERHGTFIPGGGYEPGESMARSPLVWLAGLYTAAKMHSGHQWVVAAILDNGGTWDAVRAVNVTTGEPVMDEDAAYDPEQPDVVPFSYSQFVSQVDDIIAPGTQQNWRNTHQRFPVTDPTAKMYRLKPEWRRAKFSHFMELRARDLPYDLVDACLRRAGLPATQGGMSVADIRAAVSEYYTRRDADLVADDETGDTLTAETLSYTKAQKLYGKVVTAFLVAECSLPKETAESVAYATIWWTFHRADDAFLAGAKANVEDHQLW